MKSQESYFFFPLDICTGGGSVHGGPDDTVLTVYRNLRGNDTGILFQFVGKMTSFPSSKNYIILCS